MIFAYLLHGAPNLTQEAWDPYAKASLAYLASKLSVTFLGTHLRHCRLATVLVVCTTTCNTRILIGSSSNFATFGQSFALQTSTRSA